MGARGRPLRYEVEAVGAEWMAAQQARQRHPASGPQAESPDRLLDVGRAGWQMAALVADEAGKRIAIELDQAAAGAARRLSHRIEQRAHCAAATAGRLLSIWSM